MTCHRFVRWGDSSPKQRRAERREKSPEPTAPFSILCPTTFDGDKSPAGSGDESPHSEGFALVLTAAFFKQALSGGVLAEAGRPRWEWMEDRDESARGRPKTRGRFRIENR